MKGLKEMSHIAWRSASSLGMFVKLNASQEAGQLAAVSLRPRGFNRTDRQTHAQIDRQAHIPTHLPFICDWLGFRENSGVSTVG